VIANKNILDLFMSIQSIIKPDISIEVGAHDADFSKEMIALDVDVFAFEASPYVYDRFKNDLAGIKYINSAVSNTNKKIKFEIQLDVDPSIAGNNSIKNRNESKDYSYIDVESISINEYFKDTLFSKGALWVDAEGASGEVLLGADERLKDFGSIYIELEKKDFWKDAWQRDQAVKYLNDNGFYLYHEAPCYGEQVDAIFINNKYKGLVDEALSK
jgi:FkbM family methyltransferase